MRGREGQVGKPGGGVREGVMKEQKVMGRCLLRVSDLSGVFGVTERTLTGVSEDVKSSPSLAY